MFIKLDANRNIEEYM